MQTTVIIQCAGSKNPKAGLLRTQAGLPVSFVAQPLQAPTPTRSIYARPDDQSDVPGRSWRQQVVQYNLTPERNSLRLLRAFELYDVAIYRDLARSVGVNNMLILSAGWGLVRADYLLPSYDITFSACKPKDAYKRRLPGDEYLDFCHLTS